jgi:hypothetical protein
MPKTAMSRERAGSFGAESFYRGETALVSHNPGRKALLSAQFQSSRLTARYLKSIQL